MSPRRPSPAQKSVSPYKWVRQDFESPSVDVETCKRRLLFKLDDLARGGETHTVGLCLVLEATKYLLCLTVICCSLFARAVYRVSLDLMIYDFFTSLSLLLPHCLHQTSPNLVFTHILHSPNPSTYHYTIPHHSLCFLCLLSLSIVWISAFLPTNNQLNILYIDNYKLADVMSLK